MDTLHGPLGEAELFTWHLCSASLSCSFIRAQSDAKGASKLIGGGGDWGASGGEQGRAKAHVTGFSHNQPHPGQITSLGFPQSKIMA